METSHDQASATAADKAFHLAILDATHNPVLQGFRGAIDTILSAVFRGRDRHRRLVRGQSAESRRRRARHR